MNDEGRRMNDASTGSARCLTLVVVMIGGMTCPLHLERAFCFLFCVMGVLSFQVNVLFEDGLSLSPLGDREAHRARRVYPKLSGVVDGRGVLM